MRYAMEQWHDNNSLRRFRLTVVICVETYRGWAGQGSGGRGAETDDQQRRLANFGQPPSTE